MKKWFKIINREDMEIIFTTDALVYFYYNKKRNTTIIRTINGEHEFPGNQTHNIEVAIGKQSAVKKGEQE